MTPQQFISILLMMVAFFLSDTQNSYAQTDKEQLQRAEQAYYKNDLEVAERLYGQLVNKGRISGHLYYNLANVYYRQGRLGQSIQYYEKALRRLPRNVDVRANLRFVDQKTAKNQVIEAPWMQVLGKIFFWQSYLTLKEALWITMGLNILFWGTLLGAFIKRTPLFQWATTLTFVFFFLIGSGTFYKYILENQFKWAIVIKSQISVHPTFLEPQKTVMTLPEGSKVHVLSQQELKDEGSWAQILLPNGQRGWVRVEQLGFI